ncbi:glycosyltransferase [Vibrio alginolyticus]|uniref:glycosyltransferase n=1 Tax=Vibrio alginolyticus TaxID=663 RepID=UPI00301BFED0
MPAKILHIITKSEIGGAQTWVKDQVTLLGDEFEHFIITNKSGWLTENTTVKKQFFVPEIEKGFSLKAYLKIVEFIKQNRIDVVVASSANAGLYARLLKVMVKIRVVYVSHGWSCIYNGGSFRKLYITIERVLSFLSDKILCVSEKDKQDAAKIIGINENKLIHIRNCVFPRKVQNKEVRSCFKVLFLGRLAYPKRPDLLIDAISQLPSVSLDVVGDGPLLSQCSRPENVHFTGAIENFDNFSEYDLFALISDSEGMPMSALEAASTGLPLLLSNVGGCGELITQNGLLVENDSDAILKAIHEIKNDYSDYKEQAERRSVEFDIKNSYNLYKSLYIGI